MSSNGMSFGRRACTVYVCSLALGHDTIHVAECSLSAEEAGCKLGRCRRSLFTFASCLEATDIGYRSARGIGPCDTLG
jgi:hypothetical protein